MGMGKATKAKNRKYLKRRRISEEIKMKTSDQLQLPNKSPATHLIRE
jgi:hypothetical protein